MTRRDWTALGLIVAGAYILVKLQGGMQPANLDIQSGPGIVGYLDVTQSVQYDPSTGNLWDTSDPTVNTLIATIAPNQDATVFLQPSVQTLIQGAIAARGA